MSTIWWVKRCETAQSQIVSTVLYQLAPDKLNLDKCHDLYPTYVAHRFAGTASRFRGPTGSIPTTRFIPVWWQWLLVSTGGQERIGKTGVPEEDLLFATKTPIVETARRRG